MSLDVLIPPVEKFTGGGLPFQGLVFLEKVDNKLIELLIVETIIMAHPVGSIIEGEV